MDIVAEIPSVKTIKITVPGPIPGSELKEKICTALGIEASLTTLLHDGRIIDDSETVNQDIPSTSPLIVDYLWARQLILWGIEGQKALGNSTALIAGAGALGNETAKNLAMIGVGSLIIVDFDNIEYSNLSRSVYFEKSDIGKPKSLVLAEKVQSIHPHISAEAYISRLEDLPLTVYLNSDVILSGLDNMIARVFLSTIARKYSIPLVDAGIMGYQCRLQTFLPPDSPCPLCTVPAKNYGHLTGLRNPCSGPLQDDMAPSLSTSISLISSIQVQEAVKIMIRLRNPSMDPTYIGEPLSGALIIDLKYNRFTRLPIKRSPSCIVCGRYGAASSPAERVKLRLEEVRDRETLERALKERLNAPLKEYELFRIDSEGFKKMSKEELWEDIQLYTGSYISVIWEGEGEEYREALVEVV